MPQRPLAIAFDVPDALLVAERPKDDDDAAGAGAGGGMGGMGGMGMM